MNGQSGITSDGFTVLGIAAAMLIAVVMSSGIFTYLDSVVGLMIVLACCTVRLDSSDLTVLRLLLSLTAGGGLYLMIGVIFEIAVKRYGLLPPDRCTEVEYLELCRSWHFAILWLICSAVSFIAQLVYSKLKP